jgi:hypothetical protein
MFNSYTLTEGRGVRRGGELMTFKEALMKRINEEGKDKKAAPGPSRKKGNEDLNDDRLRYISKIGRGVFKTLSRDEKLRRIEIERMNEEKVKDDELKAAKKFSVNSILKSIKILGAVEGSLERAFKIMDQVEVYGGPSLDLKNYYSCLGDMDNEEVEWMLNEKDLRELSKPEVNKKDEGKEGGRTLELTKEGLELKFKGILGKHKKKTFVKPSGGFLPVRNECWSRPYRKREMDKKAEFAKSFLCVSNWSEGTKVKNVSRANYYFKTKRGAFNLSEFLRRKEWSQMVRVISEDWRKEGKRKDKAKARTGEGGKCKGSMSNLTSLSNSYLTECFTFNGESGLDELFKTINVLGDDILRRMLGPSLGLEELELILGEIEKEMEGLRDLPKDIRSQ